ncbi:hypothetical protein [Nitrososphaera sp.]|uniref:hypothetical protein n=1 Tax=Nitrososphaera sp. TaxID=1971748 RepID=UPI00307D4CB7
MVDDAPRSHYVMKLSEASRPDTGCAGVKASNLGELARAGFPVPIKKALSLHDGPEATVDGSAGTVETK